VAEVVNQAGQYGCACVAIMADCSEYKNETYVLAIFPHILNT
jgi:hypothetical protein